MDDADWLSIEEEVPWTPRNRSRGAAEERGASLQERYFESPEWREFREVIVTALEPFDDARRAVVDAITQWKADGNREVG